MVLGWKLMGGVNLRIYKLSPTLLLVTPKKYITNNKEAIVSIL
jgi:hypothetical protein